MRVLALAVAAEAVTFAPASTTQRYADLDAAFWRDVDAQVGPDPPPRFAQFCRQFRDTWNDDVAEMGPESTELDDDKARPLLIDDQYVARHGGLFPGLRTTPWWDPADFAWLDPLVEAAPDISNELAKCARRRRDRRTRRRGGSQVPGRRRALRGDDRGAHRGRRVRRALRRRRRGNCTKELHLRKSDAVAPPGPGAQRAASSVRGVRLRARERGDGAGRGEAVALREDTGGVAGRARRGLI